MEHAGMWVESSCTTHELRNPNTHRMHLLYSCLGCQTCSPAGQHEAAGSAAGQSVAAAAARPWVLYVPMQ